MIPKHVFEALDPEEQKLWHSHEFEVSSGMLILPQPSSESNADEWEQKEIQAMREVSGLYGKTWHTWQVDRGDEVPLSYPTLMGSVMSNDQIDLDKALANRDQDYGVSYKQKAASRKAAGVKGPGISENADSWWKESHRA